MRTAAAGIFWIDGTMRIGQQLKLALVRGWAALTIPLSWRCTLPKRPGIPPNWPTRQTSLDFNPNAPQPFLLRMYMIIKAAWRKITAILQPR